MADEIPEQKPQEESKKDTVRINLPPGLAGRGGPPSVTPPAGVPLRPTPTSANPADEAKKETAVMGRPVEAPKPKKDTSRVQVSPAKPAAPEPRPALKLRQEDETPAPATATTAKAPAQAPARAQVYASDGPGAGLSLVAMLLALVVAGALAFVWLG
jgi:hypothetical protein